MELKMEDGNGEEWWLSCEETATLLTGNYGEAILYKC